MSRTKCHVSDISTLEAYEGAYLRISELNQPPFILHNLIPLILTSIEQLRQSKPLAGHLISVIGVHKLIVIHAVRSVALDTLNSRFARVQSDYVVNEPLTCWRKGDRL